MRPTESQTAADGCCASTGPAPTATTLRNRVAFTTFFMDGLLRFVVAAYNACFRTKPTTPDAAISAGSGMRFIVVMTPSVTAQIRTVGTSTRARRPSTITAPAIAPVAAAVTPSTNALMRGLSAKRRKCGAARTVTKYTGANTPMAATVAPSGPATRYPMNATVITTGPGVIIETATASRNCRSVSQWNCSTTPPCRNGTMASPLPNTNSPAAAKYQNTFQSTPTDAAPVRPDVSHAGHGATSSAVVGAAGRARARASRGMNPEATKTQMISLAVQAVTARLTVKSPQSSRSRPSVLRASLAALHAIIPMTAAPIP